MRVAMKCSQEQFDAIKDKLTNCDLITNFDKSSYLVNCYRESSITNLPYEYANAWADKCYDEWNEEIFLNACGIETEMIIKGSELQYKSIFSGDWVNCRNDSEYRLKSTKKQELENQILELQNQLKNL